jgi:exonuclease III
VLDSTLKSLHKSKTEFVICGDINVNYITDNNWKEQLSLLLSTYNLVHTVDFPTRINRNLGTAIDNIFIGNSRLNSFKIASIVNGLSDHDAHTYIPWIQKSVEMTTGCGISHNIQIYSYTD